MNNLEAVDMAAKIAETITAATMRDSNDFNICQQAGELVADFYSAVFNGIYKTLKSAFEVD